MSNVDNRVCYIHDGLPYNIVWMTFNMKNNLLQYGDMLVLDAQKWLFNKIGWPYIGITMKTKKNTLGVTSEYVVLVENINK